MLDRRWMGIEMKLANKLAAGSTARSLRASGQVCVLALVTVLLLSTRAQAQWSGRDGWVEEPGTKSLNVKDPGHSYLDPSSVHRGNDGLVYFVESTDASRPEDIGKVGLMKDAYDCARNIKYMCVELGDWRNNKDSTINAANDPALRVYRKYLCGDTGAADDSPESSNSHDQ